MQLRRPKLSQIQVYGLVGVAGLISFLTFATPEGGCGGSEVYLESDLYNQEQENQMIQKARSNKRERQEQISRLNRYAQKRETNNKKHSRSSSSKEAPELFEYEQSTLQAYYYFREATIESDELESDDWVGAFNGDVCVGARQWDTSLCNSGVCDVPVMGYDDNEWTLGYMLSGEIPLFIIYDASEDIYFNARASQYIPWENMDLNVLDSLDVLVDCRGDLGGTAWESECGCVDADNSGDECDDCAGIPNGTSVVNLCGVCEDPNDSTAAQNCAVY
ncbi:MAG: hypothetical protein QGI45_09580 [Myxococcota bacterium]|jgi:hypothetical protein|nr:hypothetical protein [Myxococcota bacterium]